MMILGSPCWTIYIVSMCYFIYYVITFPSPSVNDKVSIIIFDMCICMLVIQMYMKNILAAPPPPFITYRYGPKNHPVTSEFQSMVRTVVISILNLFYEKSRHNILRSRVREQEEKRHDTNRKLSKMLTTTALKFEIRRLFFLKCS